MVNSIIFHLGQLEFSTTSIMSIMDRYDQVNNSLLSRDVRAAAEGRLIIVSLKIDLAYHRGRM